MYTAATRIGVGRHHGHLVAYIGGSAVVVTHGGEGNDTEADAEVLERAETGHDVLKVGVVGILLLAILIKVGYLSCYSHRVRGGVEIIYLIVLAKSQAQSVHTAVESARLVGQQAQSKLTIRRVGATLCRYIQYR